MDEVTGEAEKKKEGEKQSTTDKRVNYCLILAWKDTC